MHLCRTYLLCGYLLSSLTLGLQALQVVHGFGCSFLHTRLKHPVEIVNRLIVSCVRRLGLAIVFFKGNRFDQYM